MVVLTICIAGQVVFGIAAVVLGRWLRATPSKANAEWSSRVMHLLFFVLQNFLPLVLVLWPGIFQLDAVTGLRPLAPRWMSIVAGVIPAVPGLYLLTVTNRALRSLGSGANAFRLTSSVVQERIYASTRNPMSLGFYLWLTAVGLLTGSASFTLLVLLAIVPAHLLFLRAFEEHELVLRLGPSYLEYRQRTPFLLPSLKTRQRERT